MLVAETQRLRLRRFTLQDCEFVLRLVNEPSWIQFIGDKNVRSLDDARAYIERGPLRMYEACGFGLYLVEGKDSAEPLGMCGLIKRDGLDGVDIGFAFVPEAWGHGYAHEAAAAVMEHARSDLGLKRVLAITLPSNHRSIKLLEKIGLTREGPLILPDDGEELLLYEWQAAG